MIVGIDHIAFSVSDIEKAISEVASWGYHAAFIEKEVINHRAKIPFLREWREKHDIAYCQSKVGDGLAIELTAHAVIPGTTPRVVQCEESRNAPYQVCFSATSSKIIDTVLLETSDVERSTAFWSKFGFREKGESELCFMTPIANKKLYLKLIQKPQKSQRLYHLDDDGFPCLALLTTHIERDRLLFGDTASDVFSLIIHRRRLDICLGRGPDGECVELIAVKKGV